MKLIPFENTWPYDKMMEDIYLHECLIVTSTTSSPI